MSATGAGIPLPEATSHDRGHGEVALPWMGHSCYCLAMSSAMASNFASDLTEKLRELLFLGMRLDPAIQQTVEQTLAVPDPFALAASLADCADSEAWSMRDLILFPDHELALCLEKWLADQERQGRLVSNAVVQAVKKTLANAPVRLLPARGEPFELILDQQGADRFICLLHLGKNIPAPIKAVLSDPKVEPRDGRILLKARMLCKRARLEWTSAQVAFVQALLHGCLEDRNKAGLHAELPSLLGWSLEFLTDVREGVSAALSARRAQLQRQMDAAREVERLRTLYNYETRRMLGIMELNVDMESLLTETVLLDRAIAITGRQAAPRPRLEHDLGAANCARDAVIFLDG